MESREIARFRQIVWNHYRANGRHALPWRKTRDPYRILVSESMLQQTQVERVVPFYAAFLERFPNARALANAPLSEVLRLWQGLGYNRRAKMLHAAAKALTERPRAAFPQKIEALIALPGIGPYTASAIAAFAFNQDAIVIETNIRTVVMHYFFPKKKKVSDAEIGKVLAKALPKGKAREWYAALMDYGSFLKRSGIRLNGKSRHYVKQAAFSGSMRQARGAVLKELVKGASPRARLTGLLGDSRREQLEEALRALTTEGLVRVAKGRYALAE